MQLMGARGTPTRPGACHLIVLNVVIHVIDLGLINESVVRVLSGAFPHRRFMPTIAVGMGRYS